MNFIKNYLRETELIVKKIDQNKLLRIINLILKLRKSKGRIFFLGVGGSAGNASHAVNDFRKIGKFECYAPTDNVSELTAITNDEGWDKVFCNWLITSKLSKKDILIIFSVGGGNDKKKISVNLIEAIKLAKKRKAKILGVVGKKNGYTAKMADECLVIPIVNLKHITPHSEAFQSVIWHLIISHPKMKIEQTKWESISAV
jgi:D-sedoheptulose 7-phosphate isomerase